MSKFTAFNDLVRSLYLASAGLGDFDQCLRHSRRLFNSNFVGFLSTDMLDYSSHIPLAIGISKPQRVEYCDSYGHDNAVLEACMPDLLSGNTANSSDYFTDTEMAKTPYYNEFLKRIDVFYNAGFVCGSLGDRIYLLNMGRGRSKHRFSAEELGYMKALKPHAEAALHINSHVNLLKLESQSKSSALDKLTVGVCLVTKELRVMEANLIARQILDDGEFIRSTNGHLTTGYLGHYDVQKMLFSMSRGLDINSQIKVTNQTSHAHYFLSAFPVLDSGEFYWMDSTEAHYILFIGTELTPGEHCRSFLLNEYGLTPREVELVSQILSGSSLTKAALCLQVSHETARSHLKSIFMKMDIHSQSQLAVTVSRLNSVH